MSDMPQEYMFETIRPKLDHTANHQSLQVYLTRFLIQVSPLGSLKTSSQKCK
jgi:hypothetical protein